MYDERKFEESTTAFLAALILDPTNVKAQVFLDAALDAQRQPALSPPLPGLSALKQQDATPVPTASAQVEKKATILPDYVTAALNRQGRSKALLKAVEEEHIGAITHLLSQDTDVNTSDLNGRTPLTIACQKGNRAIILMLMTNGAPVNDEKAQAALLEATNRGDREVVQLLVVNGAPLVKIVQKQGPTLFSSEPLQPVVARGDEDLLRFFISTKDLPNGLKFEKPHTYVWLGGVDASGSRTLTIGEHALIEACRQRQLGIARLLCEKTVDLNKIVYHHSQTTMRYSSYGGQRGPEVVTKKTLREEALQVSSGFPEIVEFLNKGLSL